MAPNFFISLDCLTFTIYQSIMTMTRMSLRQLVTFLTAFGLTATADFFGSCANDSTTVDGWIDINFVKRHLIVDGGRDISFWREVQANVTMSIEMDA